MKPPNRALTTLAVGFLLLDAVLFAVAAVAGARPWFAVPAVLCGLGAWGVIVAWRRYRRMLEELESARREMRSEIEAIRELLHERNFHN